MHVGSEESSLDRPSLEILGKEPAVVKEHIIVWHKRLEKDMKDLTRRDFV